MTSRFFTILGDMTMVKGVHSLCCHLIPSKIWRWETPLPFPWQNQILLRKAIIPTRHCFGLTEQGQMCAPLASSTPPKAKTMLTVMTICTWV